MPKVYCYLNQKTIDELEQIKQVEEHESTSQVLKEMVTLGIRVYQMNRKDSELNESEKLRLEKEEELRKQHTVYMLRLLALNADILRCVYDNEKIPKSQNDVEHHILEIKKSVDKYLNDFITTQ